MRAIVIYESLTGNTKAAAGHMVVEFRNQGWEATASSTKQVDLAALQAADVVVVGTWVDGLLLVGQRPGGSGRLRKLPLLGGKPTFGYVTYAIHPGSTLEKLSATLTDQGADVRGALTIRRDELHEGSVGLVSQIVAAFSDASA